MALSSKGGGGSRSRPYGMMLLLAFGAAVLGVMVLHKLRERRIFSIIIQDKDQNLMNLHLLLKKERESTRDYKRKIDDLKAKAYSLRAQKIECINKVAALQSITTSLKDEHTVLESIIQEKQNTIKLLQQKRPGLLSNGISQIAALKELLKQKEAKIEEMKRVASTKPTKIWSVSTDDPSKPLVNGTFAVVVGDNVVTNVGERSQNVSEATMVKDDLAGDNNVDGFLAGTEKDTSNTTEVISTHLDDEALKTEGQSGNAMAMNGTEQATKLSDREDNEG